MLMRNLIASRLGDKIEYVGLNVAKAEFDAWISVRFFQAKSLHV